MSLHCSKHRKKKHKVKTLMLKTNKERIIPLSKCLVCNRKKSKLIKLFSKIPMLVDIFFLEGINTLIQDIINIKK